MFLAMHGALDQPTQDESQITERSLRSVMTARDFSIWADHQSLTGAVRDHGAFIAGTAGNVGFAGERCRRLFWTKRIDRGFRALTGHCAFLICGASTAHPPHLHRGSTRFGRAACRSSFSAQTLQPLRPRRTGLAALAFWPL
jgi:hypothetical protein